MTAARLLAPVLACLFALGLTLLPPVEGAAQGPERVIDVVVSKSAFTPRDIQVRRGMPVTLRFFPSDVAHGFACPGLGLRVDIPPGQPTSLRFVPEQTGRFPFKCDIYCGIWHPRMTGTITVTD